MSSRLTIKYYFSFLAIFCFSFLFGQNEASVISSPYRNDHNPWFQFGVFQRGYPNEALSLTLDSLEAKQRKYWTRSDSLQFAAVSKKTGNLELASYYFDHLHANYATEESYWWEQLVVHFVQREYNTCLEDIKQAEPGLVEFSKLWFFKKICDARLRSLKDEKWYKEESVLSWPVDSSLIYVDKSSELFNEKVITPLNNLSFVLELLIRHIYENDDVIGRTCLEMSRILKTHISSTQAFIALSLGKNFLKSDDDIQDELAAVKADLIKNHYRIPIFRKYLPRVEAWRFDYELLKEKIIYEMGDTASKHNPLLYKEPERKEISFNTQFVLLAGLIVIFTSVLVFLRTRKK